MQLPSIQTLRAFDAAGRHQSYSRAADELCLTQSAVSQRIRELENRTGLKLFQRDGHRMVPTPEGSQLLANIRHALLLLEQVFSTRRTPDKPSHQLTLSVMPALVSCWLLPRMEAFRVCHPKVELEFEVAVELADFRDGHVDLAIRYGPGGWPGLQTIKLAPETLFPVCAPAYRQRMALEHPADLARCRLLRMGWLPWGPWLRATGLDLPEPSTGPAYKESALLLQAAAAGEGVALARGLLALDAIRAGQLVRLFDLSILDTYAYYLVWPAGRADHAARDAFGAWIATEMAAEARLLAAWSGGPLPNPS